MESLNRPINGSYEAPQRPPEPGVEGYMADLRRDLREEPVADGPSQPKQRQRSKQEILQEYPIGIKFLSRGCIVEVGCKTVAFTTVEEAMAAIRNYVADPETVGEYWRGQFNM